VKAFYSECIVAGAGEQLNRALRVMTTIPDEAFLFCVDFLRLRNEISGLKCEPQAQKKELHFCNSLILDVAGAGLEPATFGL